MRKLAYVSLSFALAVFINEYLVPSGFSLIFGAVFAVLFITGLFFKDKKRLRILLITGSMAISFLYCAAYDNIFVSHNEIYDGKEETVFFTVTDYPVETSYGARVDVKFKNDIGINVKTRLYLYEDYPEDLIPGNEIKAAVSFSFADEIYGEESDAYFAKGTVLLAYQKGEVLKADTGSSFVYFPKILAEKIKLKISEIFDDGSAPFVTAILTGDSSLLSENDSAVHDMKIAGIYHIVAVSGMHLSFLLGFFLLLSGNKRRSCFLAVPGIIIFMMMTGMRPSVVRAGIMQIIFLASFFAGRDNDTVTSISFALLVLLIFNPTACKDVGLQLSFAATFGIILITPKINKAVVGLVSKLKIYKNKIFARTAGAVIGAFSASIGATVFTMPLVAIYFGYISIIAPVSNVLIFFAISVAFCLSLVAVASGFIFLPAGRIIAFIAGLVVKYIILVAKIMSSFRFSAVYTNNILIPAWIAVLYIVLIYMIAKRKSPRSYIVPVCGLISSLCIIFIISPSILKTSGFTVTALDVGQGASTLITSEDSTVLIDCGSSSGEDAGEIAVNYLLSYNETFIDAIVLTHYHTDHANGITKVIESIDVSTVILPEPMPTDLDVYTGIEKAAEENDTEIVFITEDTTVSFSNEQMTVFAPRGALSENERGLSVLYSKLGYDVLITGDMQSEIEKKLIENIDFPDIEILMVGHHGSKYSTCDELLDETTPEIAIISVGHNTYGHPTEEILEKLTNRNIKIYRTDIDGNIVIRAGD